VFNLIPRDASPIVQEQNGLRQAHPSVVFGEKSRFLTRYLLVFLRVDVEDEHEPTGCWGWASDTGTRGPGREDATPATPAAFRWAWGIAARNDVGKGFKLLPRRRVFEWASSGRSNQRRRSEPDAGSNETGGAMIHRMRRPPHQKEPTGWDDRNGRALLRGRCGRWAARPLPRHAAPHRHPAALPPGRIRLGVQSPTSKPLLVHPLRRRSVDGILDLWVGLTVAAPWPILTLSGRGWPRRTCWTGWGGLSEHSGSRSLSWACWENGPISPLSEIARPSRPVRRLNHHHRHD
jgi:hypothetical protein